MGHPMFSDHKFRTLFSDDFRGPIEGVPSSLIDKSTAHAIKGVGQMNLFQFVLTLIGLLPKRKQATAAICVLGLVMAVVLVAVIAWLVK